MSEPKLFECPACGSPLSTDGSVGQVVCGYCGRTVIVPEALRVQPQPPEPVRPAGPFDRPPIAQPARRRRSGCGCASIPVVIIALLVIGSLALLSPGRGVQKLRAAAGLPTAVPTVVPVDRPLTASLPRQVQYANLHFSVTGGTITNQISAEASNHERLLKRGQAHAYLSIKVDNPTTNGIEADMNLISLHLAGGQRYAEESGFAEWVNAESSLDAKLYFTVPISATWQGAQLVVGLPGREPAVLALDGPAAQPRYPLALSDKGKATVQEIDYEIQAARVDLDAGGKRAAAGRRFLVFALRINNHNPAAGGVAISSSNFRLAVGSDMIAPVTAPIEAVAPSSVLQGEVVFDIPANPGQVELQVGEVGRGDTRRIPVNIPAS